MIEIKITSNEVNKRLDKFVKKYLSKAPDSFIYKLFRKKDVKVNKKPKPIDYITQENDVSQIYISKEQEAEFIENKSVTVSKAKDFKVIY
jgi:23S rRNA pseudouridine955/2504/2580 synthase